MAAESRQVTLVTAPNCHLCEHARRVLARLGGTGALRIQEVDWDSIEGRDLVRRDRPLFPPALYLDGALWGYGRLSEGRLRRSLAALGKP